MRKVAGILAVVFMMALTVSSAFAANSLNAGSKALSVGVGDSFFSNKAMPYSDAFINDVVTIQGRVFAMKDVAFYGGFGFQSDGGDADGTYFSLMAGLRKYLKVDDLAPFFEAQFSYTSVDAKNGNTKVADLTDFDLAGLFGAEYFVGKQFSFEGSAGLGIGQVKVGDVKDTYFGTRVVGVRANFYF